MAEPISIISDLQQVLSLMSPAYQLDVRRADTRYPMSVQLNPCFHSKDIFLLDIACLF